MKPIRDYNDGQWLLLLWAFIVVFLITGFAISTPVLVVAILAALGAGYTTYLYVRERIGQSPSGSILGGRFAGRRLPSTPEPFRPDPAPHDTAPHDTGSYDTENREGGTA